MLRNSGKIMKLEAKVKKLMAEKGEEKSNVVTMDNLLDFSEGTATPTAEQEITLDEMELQIKETDPEGYSVYCLEMGYQEL